MATKFPMGAMTYEEYLSNTAHQREVADLRAAGLNPVLSSGGSGASTPSISDTSALAVSKAMSVANKAVSNSAKAVQQALQNSQIQSIVPDIEDNVYEKLANLLNGILERNKDKKILNTEWSPTVGEVKEAAELLGLDTSAQGIEKTAGEIKKIVGFFEDVKNDIKKNSNSTRAYLNYEKELVSKGAKKKYNMWKMGKPGAFTVFPYEVMQQILYGQKKYKASAHGR